MARNTGRKRAIRQDKLANKVVRFSENPAMSPRDLLFPEALARVRQMADAGALFNAGYIVEQLRTQAPKSEDLLLAAVRIQTQLGRYSEAEDAVRRLLSLYPTSARTLATVAERYRHCSRAGQALPLFEKASALSPKSAEYLYGIAACHFELGDSDAALSHCEWALGIEPAFAPAWWGRAQMVGERVGPDVLPTLEALLTSGAPREPAATAMLHYSAAHHYGNSDVSRQFWHLDKGATAARQVAPYDHAQVAHYFAEARRYISPAMATGQQDAPPEACRRVFVASLPRSGTTLLERMLAGHSRIATVGESVAFTHAQREVAFAHGLRPAYWQWPGGDRFGQMAAELRVAYGRHHLVAEARAEVVVDKSMDNTRDLGAMLLAFPGSKAIHLERNPMDVVLSAYRLYFASAYGYTYDLENCARYVLLASEQMAYWNKLFPDRILSLRYEDLARDPGEALARICRFLSLPEESGMLRADEATQVRTASSLQVREEVHQRAIARWRQYEEFLKPALDVFESVAPEELLATL